jgi:hypothetical protein
MKLCSPLVAVLAATLSFSACAGDDPAAEDSLFSAMRAGDYAGADAVIDELRAVYDEDPTDARRAFVLASAHLWRVAEARRDPATDAEVSAEHGPQMVRFFSEAVENEPENPYYAGFLGLVLWDSGLFGDDPELMEAGEQLIERSAAEAPEFGLVLRILAYRDFPAGTPRFELAVESYWSWLETCFETSIDRANPDLGPLLTEERIASFSGPARKFCWETDRVPNAAKATYLSGGDLLVKQGEIEAARIMYENIEHVPGAASWPHRDVLEDRLAADLATRAAAYSDPDPARWPAQAKPPLSCTFCHQGD